MSTRRELAAAALLCVAGAGLVVAAAGRHWASVTIAVSSPMKPIQQSLTGRELTGVAAALGWAGLAGLAALVATRGWVRAGVGVLLALFGAGVISASMTAGQRGHVIEAIAEKSSFARVGVVTVEHSSWWVVSVAGGVLLVAAGILAAVRGRRWPGMSARYEAPAARPARTPISDDPAGLWKSLDHGEDPTVRRAAKEGSAELP